MTSSTQSPFSRFIGRLVAVLTIGALMLIVGTASAFAGGGHQVSGVSSNAAPVVSTGGSVSLNEDDDDDDDDDDEDEEGGGGGGLPATDTAPVPSTQGVTRNAAPVVSTGGSVSLNEDDDDDDDDDDEEGGGGGGLPSTDTAPELSASGSSAPIAPIAISVLMIAGLVGGTMKMAAKRTN